MRESRILKQVVERYAKRQGMTMVQVAASLLMSPASLSQKLGGKRPITLEEAHSFAEMLGITLDALYLLVL